MMIPFYQPALLWEARQTSPGVAAAVVAKSAIGSDPAIGGMDSSCHDLQGASTTKSRILQKNTSAQQRGIVRH